MSHSPPPSYDSCSAPPLPSYSILQPPTYNHATNNTSPETEAKPPRPQTGAPPEVPNSMILPPSVPPGGVEGPPMLPPYPYPSPAPPYHSYNVGYYSPMSGSNGGGPLGMPDAAFCQSLRAGNGRSTPQGGRYYVNSSGYIEHLTAEQYQNRRVVQAVASVCAIVLMIVIFCIAIKNMHG